MRMREQHGADAGIDAVGMEPHAANIDPSFIIAHRLPLGAAPQAYEMFTNKEDECLKVVLTAA